MEISETSFARLTHVDNDRDAAWVREVKTKAVTISFYGLHSSRIVRLF